MPDSSYPPRKTSSARELDRSLLVTLKEMLDDDETITARGAVRRLVSVGAASSLTRDSWRAAILADYQDQQSRVRKQIEKSDKSSKTKLSAALAKERARVEELERKVALLTASHLGLIQAVGEIGGLRAWTRFFQTYDSATAELRALGAMPEADILPLAQTGDDLPGRRRD